MALKLTLGPVLFNWSAERLIEFYAGIADAPYDRVILGEVVCGKRMPFSDPVWPDIAQRLMDAGKDVVFSTLALPSLLRERKAIAEICGAGASVEINDITGLMSLKDKGFHVGPFVNVYNEGAARFLTAKGAATLCLPVELSLASAGTIARAVPEAEVEIFAFGRLPLAVSGRCYHARLHGLHKDSCQFVCDRDPDGLAVDTLEGQDFLAINGIQTLSKDIATWCPTPAEMQASGIARLRLSPHTVDMVAVGTIYRALLDDEMTPRDAHARLGQLGLPGKQIDGYQRGLAGCAAVEPA
jgi:collagenase-like PrtC family protease